MEAKLLPVNLTNKPTYQQTLDVESFCQPLTLIAKDHKKGISFTH